VSFQTMLQVLVGPVAPGTWTSLLDDVAGGNSSR